MLFVLLVAVVSGAVTPYVLIYLVRRKQRAGCRTIVVVVLAGLALGVVVGLILRPVVESRLLLPQVQQAVDEQCGEGVVEVNLSGFVSSPYYRWESDRATCHYFDADRRWDCYCPEVGE